MNLLKQYLKCNIPFEKTSITSLDKLLVDIELILFQSDIEHKDLVRSQCSCVVNKYLKRQFYYLLKFHGYFPQSPISIKKKLESMT